MSFDEQPDGDIHDECAAEIHRLESEVALEQSRANQFEKLLHNQAETIHRLEKERDALAKEFQFIGAINKALMESQASLAIRVKELETGQAERDAAYAAEWQDALGEALHLYDKAGFGNSTNFALQGYAYDKAVEALPDLSADWLWKHDAEVLRDAAYLLDLHVHVGDNSSSEIHCATAYLMEMAKELEEQK